MRSPRGTIARRIVRAAPPEEIRRSYRQSHCKQTGINPNFHAAPRMQVFILV
jgi:hypothetical protein